MVPSFSMYCTISHREYGAPAFSRASTVTSFLEGLENALYLALVGDEHFGHWLIDAKILRPLACCGLAVFVCVTALRFCAAKRRVQRKIVGDFQHAARN